ncbi:MAG: NAD(P)-binding protein [Pseudomonadota bacterium]
MVYWGNGSLMEVAHSQSKTINVVGGGPAGMQFAATAAARGHDVHLFEKEHELGGRMSCEARSIAS